MDDKQKLSEYQSITMLIDRLKNEIMELEMLVKENDGDVPSVIATEIENCKKKIKNYEKVQKKILSRERNPNPNVFQRNSIYIKTSNPSESSLKNNYVVENTVIMSTSQGVEGNKQREINIILPVVGSIMVNHEPNETLMDVLLPFLHQYNININEIYGIEGDSRKIVPLNSNADEYIGKDVKFIYKSVNGMISSTLHDLVEKMFIIPHICYACNLKVVFGYKCQKCEIVSHKKCYLIRPNGCEQVSARKLTCLLSFDSSKININENDNNVSNKQQKDRSFTVADSFTDYYHNLISENSQVNHSVTSPDQFDTSHNKDSNSNTKRVRNSILKTIKNIIKISNKTPKSESVHMGKNNYEMQIKIRGQSAILDHAFIKDNNINFLSISKESSQKPSMKETFVHTEIKTVNEGTNNTKDENWTINYSDLKLLESVGHGSFGEVFKSFWHGDVAVKIIKGNTSIDKNLLERIFGNEITILKRARHNNVLLFLGMILEPKIGIVTQWCNGLSLYEYIHERKGEKPLSYRKAIDYTYEIACGMGYLHERIILHRDLKSKNVFISDNHIKIGDFGLSIFNNKIINSSLESNNLIGSILWMAPEVIRYAKIGFFVLESDVYSFGIIFYELLSGLLPYNDIKNKEYILYGVGTGTLKPDLSCISCNESKNAINLLKEFINFEHTERPSFTTISQKLKDEKQSMPLINRRASADDIVFFLNSKSSTSNAEESASS